MNAGIIFRPGMRVYFNPPAAGLALTISAFLPWVIVGDAALKGVPDTPALCVEGLGIMSLRDTRARRTERP
jgi:hypothetical protein